MLRTTLRGATPPLLAAAALLAVPLAGLAAEPDKGRGGHEDERTLRRSYRLDPGSEVRIEVPYGGVRVERGEPGRVEVVLVGECEHGGDRCRDRLARVEVEGRERADRLEIEVTGLPRMSGRGLQLDLHVLVPAGHALAVDMGAGEIRVEDLDRDVRVELGAGQIDVRLAERTVGSVDLSAGVGEARLERASGTVETERRHLVGGSVEWRAGPGEAHVDLEVGAGEVVVRLDAPPGAGTSPGTSATVPLYRP
jgi:hypothetical protein